MTAPALLCATLEVTLNRLLRLESSALAECGRMEGRRLALEADDIGWRLLIEPGSRGARVFSDDSLAADVTAKAPAARLLRVALQAASGDGRLPQALEIDGDAELLQRFARTLAGVGFDPEELAAQWLGDAGAHRLTHGLHGLFGWGRRSAETLGYSTAEYLREETGDLASAGDANEWLDGVERLRDGVDRFEARLQRLERRSGVPTRPSEITGNGGEAA